MTSDTLHKFAKTVRRVAMEHGGEVLLTRDDHDRLRAAGYGIHAESMLFTETDCVHVKGFAGYREPMSANTDID